MASCLAVVPVLDAGIAEPCLTSMCDPTSAWGIAQRDVLVVDNTRDGTADAHGCGYYRDPDGHNLGVARSWNVAACRVLAEQLDYLVLVSAVVEFGPELHTTWAARIDEWAGARIIESEIHSWHLIAIHRSAFERVGVFDPNFYPYAFEAIDWCYRLRMVGWEQGFIRTPINAMSRGVAAHSQIVSTPATPLLDYYAEKWGGPKGSERWVQPWGDQPLDYWPERSIPDLADRYGLGERGRGWW